MGSWYFDSTYVLVVIGVVLSLIAEFLVDYTFWKYSQKKNSSGLTGAETAKKS